MEQAPDTTFKARILVVEDDDVTRGLLAGLLASEGYAVDAVESGEDGLRALNGAFYDLVLLDINLPGASGLEVLATAVPLHPATQFIMMTAFGSVENAVQAMQLGAFHYLTKPLRTDELRLSLDRALQGAELKREVANLRLKTGGGAQSTIVGRSQPVQQMLDLLARVAPTRATVLIEGETGTGKELVARAIHDLSDRARKPFIPVNCSALPETLLESELFGHVKGSFTGAVNDRRGLFEEANGGTLFLDEIATINPAVQVKLLRVLQERVVTRVGGSQSISIDFRLVAATNEDLSDAVAEGRFRSDLFYRLNVCQVHVPPLRERKDDLPLLVNHFLQRFAGENGISVPAVPPAEMRALIEHGWPGNVRELEHTVERAIITQAGAPEIRFDLPVDRTRHSDGLLDRAAAEEWEMARLEREYILRVLQKTGGHKGHAADILQIDRRTLYRKLREYGVRDGWRATGAAAGA